MCVARMISELPTVMNWERMDKIGPKNLLKETIGLLGEVKYLILRTATLLFSIFYCLIFVPSDLIFLFFVFD